MQCSLLLSPAAATSRPYRPRLCAIIGEAEKPCHHFAGIGGAIAAFAPLAPDGG
jgi:hypothetical protein